MIIFDYERGEGVKKCQNCDYLICERPYWEMGEYLEQARSALTQGLCWATAQYVNKVCHIQYSTARFIVTSSQ